MMCMCVNESADPWGICRKMQFCIFKKLLTRAHPCVCAYMYSHVPSWFIQQLPTINSSQPPAVSDNLHCVTPSDSATVHSNLYWPPSHTTTLSFSLTFLFSERGLKFIGFQFFRLHPCIQIYLEDAEQSHSLLPLLTAERSERCPDERWKHVTDSQVGMCGKGEQRPLSLSSACTDELILYMHPFIINH